MTGDPLTGLTVARAQEVLREAGVGTLRFRTVLPPRDEGGKPGPDWRVLSAAIGEDGPGTATLTVCRPVRSLKGTPGDG
jgi:hypothetical protein